MDKRYDHLTQEQKNQDYWYSQNTYSTSNNPGPLYSIDTPPPTVSGSLHIGHIFSYTQTDVVARYKRMSGYSVFYPFGFDDNGLPTERYVETKRGVKGYQLPRSEFIKICLEESALAAENFKKLWQRMGISADWTNTYSTISTQSRYISQASFIELFEKGHIYRKNEAAPYCVTCCTSVAQAELDDKEVASHFNDILFKDQSGGDLVIGTTRPELLPSCVALLYNPADTRYTHLAGQKATVPVYDYQVPIIADELVDIEKGTGLVMCCTFGDKKDIEWFKKHNLPYKPSIELTGKWATNTGILAGLKVHDARTRILEALRADNQLVSQRSITHVVNVHERCKKEIEFMLLSQWFVNILPLKQEFLAKADQIEWHPGFMKSRYVNWVENLGWDWCISRQRFFGIPFPVWHCGDCKAILLADIKALPVDPQETKYTGACKNCKSTNIIPDTDVMDTWNTSSLTPYICASLYSGKLVPPSQLADFIPMSMRPQAHDIIRTWAFDTIVKTTMHQDSIPWRDIVISGHVQSDNKEKLSKSKEHKALSPESLLATYPADAIRYWTAQGSLGHDTPFSDNQIKIGLRLITKLWNAFLFIKEHIQAADTNTPPAELGVLNEWLLHEASKTFANYNRYYEQYEAGLALMQAEQFFWSMFCDNYIELVKNQLFNPQLYSEKEVAATRWTLHNVGLRILQWYAPYVPHITESIYLELYKAGVKKDSLHQTRFLEHQQMFEFEESAQLAQQITTIAGQARKLKTEKQLSLKVPLATLTIASTNAHLLDKLKAHEQLIFGVTHAQKISYVCEARNSGIESAGVEKVGEVEQELWHAVISLETQN